MIIRLFFMALVVNTLLLPSFAEATQKSRAMSFIRGGTFCFQRVTKDNGGWISVIKMFVVPSSKPKQYSVARINAIQHGRPVDRTKNGFYEEMVGTAAIRPDNIDGSQRLQIMLVGHDFGKSPTNGPDGLWSDSFVFSLNPDDLSGTLFGRTVFAGIEPSTVPVQSELVATVDQITLVSCEMF